MQLSLTLLRCSKLMQESVGLDQMYVRPLQVPRRDCESLCQKLKQTTSPSLWRWRAQKRPTLAHSHECSPRWI